MSNVNRIGDNKYQQHISQENPFETGIPVQKTPFSELLTITNS